MTNIDSARLRAALQDGGEIALLDVREQGEFGQCHLFHANNTPLSRIELEIVRLVPRKDTRIVLTSAGVPGLCDSAAAVRGPGVMGRTPAVRAVGAISSAYEAN